MFIKVPLEMKTLLIIGSENYSGRLSCGSLVRIQQGVQNKQSDEIVSNLKMIVIAFRKIKKFLKI